MPLGAYRLNGISASAAGPKRPQWTLATARATSSLPTAVTAQSRWGTHSLEFTNTNPGNSITFSRAGVNATDSLTSGGLVPTGTTEPFTIEGWFWMPNPRLGSGQIGIYDAGRLGIACGIQSNRTIYMGQTGITYGLTSTSGVVPQSTWTHLVFMRNSAGARWIFVDGVVRAYTSGTISYSFTNPYGNWTIPVMGQDPFPNVVNPLVGFVNDFRISKEALYPTNVTTTGQTSFSTPTEPLINLASTVLLIPGDDGQVVDDAFR